MMPNRICQYQCLPLDPGNPVVEVIFFYPFALYTLEVGGGLKSSFCTRENFETMDDP